MNELCEQIYSRLLFISETAIAVVIDFYVYAVNYSFGLHLYSTLQWSETVSIIGEFQGEVSLMDANLYKKCQLILWDFIPSQKVWTIYSKTPKYNVLRKCVW